MAIDTASPRSRRTILLAALGAVATAVATAVGRASPVGATNGEIMHVAHTYSATRPTGIDAIGASDALSGSSDSGTGVWGFSATGIAISGNSGSDIAVRGGSSSTNRPAIFGESYANSTGVQGFSSIDGSEDPPPAPDKTGVHGYANQDDEAVGVSGQSPLGTGVFGRAPHGRGGQFSGGLAQLRLVPATAKVPPQTGVKGDLFVDAGGNLWFCKGGTYWKQIA